MPSIPSIAFTIDPRSEFWLLWNGWLLRSSDAVTWKVDSELRAGREQPHRVDADQHAHVTWDAAGRLVWAHRSPEPLRRLRAYERGGWKLIAGEEAEHPVPRTP